MKFNMRSLLEIIRETEKDKVAIGHFNISNLEQLKAISHVAAKLNVPVIIGTSEGERDYIGVHHAVDLVKSYNKEHAKGNYRLFLNADHTHTLENARKAAEVGYDAILFDGGKLPLEENIRATKEVVEMVRKINKNILVEGELGYIGSSSEVRKEIPEGAAINPGDLTRPEEAARFVEETGVDMLAPAVGNIHGMFANAPEPRLDIERIREIKKAVENLPAGRQVPLVLHGASGNTDEDLSVAIDAGISIIHISTELRVAWRKGLEEALKENPDEVAPYKLMPEDLAEMEKVVERKLRLFNKL
ncbi:MAG: Ketose-bisphosphate aldolase, class-II [Candidatus Jorgensenbacteria bacterium GW2011_GWC1_48_8]|uniref:Ketose-bisphosphate aldolase, class-II n=2 Tax=Candidatus Joergenseniibacteriota TaxID=1752739 RepID=A0A0G1XY27_9BACT|nr:MAG: Ketose-bisphosphate aldolase, class-II [Candidatus Jorgensenbacteria bacterium GW2011_GWC1_48_8]